MGLWTDSWQKYFVPEVYSVTKDLVGLQNEEFYKMCSVLIGEDRVDGRNMYRTWDT